MEIVSNLGEMVSAACERFAVSTAIVDAAETIQYRDIASEAERVSRALLSKHLTSNEPVLVSVGNRARDLGAFAGVWLAGGAVVPISVDAPRPVVDEIRKSTGARMAIANQELLFEPAPVESREQQEILKDAAIIIFTSGSTGRPKGVVLSHNALFRKLLAIDEVLAFSGDTTALLPLRITFIFGVWVALLTLKKGGALVMEERFEPNALRRSIQEARASDVALVPTMLRKMLSLDAPTAADYVGDRSLRIVTGGELFSKALWQQLQLNVPNASVIDVYGSTETCSSDFFQVQSCGGDYQESLGRLCSGVKFRIADQSGREVAPGAIGELQIASPFMMNGYLNAADLTRDAFSDEFFRTGDLARLSRDGAPQLVGRAKDLIVRGGAKISPLELEALIAQHPSVLAALSVGMPDAILGERIHVLVVPRAGVKADEAELRQWISERIEKFKRPDVFQFARELPTSSNGKVDREALRRSISGASSH